MEDVRPLGDEESSHIRKNGFKAAGKSFLPKIL